VLGLRHTVVGGLAKPERCLCVVARCTMAPPAGHADSEFRCGKAPVGGLAEPEQRLCRVRAKTFALAVHQAEVVLRCRIALVREFAKQLGRPRKIPGRALDAAELPGGFEFAARLRLSGRG